MLYLIKGFPSRLSFLYTQEDVLEIRQKLYELEDYLSQKDFIRISKSIIVNTNQIRSLRPELNRTILATMCNGKRFLYHMVSPDRLNIASLLALFLSCMLSAL